jgi:hypothetical protein
MEQVRSNPLVCIIKQFLQKYTNNDNKDDRERWLIHLNNQGGSSECCKQPLVQQRIPGTDLLGTQHNTSKQSKSKQNP